MPELEYKVKMGHQIEKSIKLAKLSWSSFTLTKRSK